jgi:hypothetical protein
MCELEMLMPGGTSICEKNKTITSQMGSWGFVFSFFLLVNGLSKNFMSDFFFSDFLWG